MESKFATKVNKKRQMEEAMKKEVGSRKLEDGRQKTEVGRQKTEVGR